MRLKNCLRVFMLSGQSVAAVPFRRAGQRLWPLFGLASVAGVVAAASDSRAAKYTRRKQSAKRLAARARRAIRSPPQVNPWVIHESSAVGHHLV